MLAASFDSTPIGTDEMLTGAVIWFPFKIPQSISKGENRAHKTCALK
jgi:hypothetical protein